MSPIKIAVWSAIIEPGKEFHCIVPRDFVITNAALGEDLADPTGRSVVKLTHEIVPEKALRRPDFDEESDEEEEEEEEEEELKELPSRTVVLTSLTAGKTEQSTLNLTFTEEDEIIITVTGQNVVHLSGNYLDQEPDANQDPDSDSEYDDYSDPEGEDWSDEEDMDDEMADESTASITEIPEKKSAKRSAAVAELTAPAATEAPLTKTEKKKQAKKLKTESGAAAAAPVEEKKAAAPAPKAEEKKAAPAEKKAAKKGPTTHPNGLVVEDSKLGSGVVAKSGKKVGMRYIGKLGNGKVFDSNTNGKPFVFNLGRGEVIKGWDQGVAGMAIGGERKLTIPAALAYGNKALPGIPKNSTLHFEVKLVSVN